MFNKGVFTVSLDFELAWGRIEEEELKDFLPLIRDTRSVVKELIAVFDQYNCAVTWATVGQLMEKEYFGKDGLTAFYEKISLQSLQSDKMLNEKGNSLLIAPDLIQALLNAKVKHDIGSHTFQHIVFDWLRCTKNIAQQDIANVVKKAAEWNIEMKSFVYSRNGIAHKEVLVQNGFTNYRGKDKTSYNYLPSVLQKLIRQAEPFYPVAPQTVMPFVEENGLVEIPGSMLFRITHQGFKNKASVSTLVKRAKKGIDKAADRKEIFHLWFHPFNFAYRRKEHFDGFTEVLEYVSQKRKEGTMEILTMSDIAQKVKNGI